MNTVVYQELIKVARKKSVTYYSDIAVLAGLNMDLQLDRNKIGKLLDEINRYEHAAKRPLLSAVVVHKDEMIPGAGFFKLAQALGLFDGVDRDKFYIQELRRVHDYW
jgi:hypothetical protein